MIWNVDPVCFSLPEFLGGREIRYYGLLYAVALMGAFMFWQWQVMRTGRTREQAERFLLIAVAAVIFGARIGHCVFYHPEYYLAKPWEILEVWKGGLASHGATVTLLLTLVYYARTESMTIREVFDRFAIGVSWAASIIRLGNLMNSEIVGRVTDLSFGFKFPLHEISQIKQRCNPQVTESCIETARGWVDINLVPVRHPSQLYEAALEGLLLFLALNFIARHAAIQNRSGFLTGAFLSGYAASRIFVELFRQPDPHIGFLLFNLTMGQWLSLPMLAAGIYIMFRSQPAK